MKNIDGKKMRTQDNLLLLAGLSTSLILLTVAAIDPALAEQKCHHAKVLEPDSSAYSLALVEGRVVKLASAGLQPGRVFIVKSHTRLISRELSYSVVSNPSECRF